VYQDLKLKHQCVREWQELVVFWNCNCPPSNYHIVYLVVYISKSSWMSLSYQLAINNRLTILDVYIRLKWAFFFILTTLSLSLSYCNFIFLRWFLIKQNHHLNHFKNYIKKKPLSFISLYYKKVLLTLYTTKSIFQKVFGFLVVFLIIFFSKIHPNNW